MKLSAEIFALDKHNFDQRDEYESS